MTHATRTGRAVALAASLTGLFVALGVVDGVFARLESDLLVGLAAFALGFAIATYALDPEVRAWARGIRRSAARRPAARPGGSAAARTSARGSDARRARPAG